MIHQQDFAPLMDLWWKFMKPTYAEDKGDVLADMYAYIMAAAHLNIKHVRMEQYMVSNGGSTGEGWGYVDSLTSMSCTDPQFPAGASKPTFIHAASHYKACSKGDTPLAND